MKAMLFVGGLVTRPYCKADKFINEQHFNFAFSRNAILKNTANKFLYIL